MGLMEEYASNWKGQHIMEKSEAEWAERPIEADCLNCDPRPGTGFVGEVPCGQCLGTGLTPVPLSDLGIPWDAHAVQSWLVDRANVRLGQY